LRYGTQRDAERRRFAGSGPTRGGVSSSGKFRIVCIKFSNKPYLKW
jgi:hypothetical protein